jgi:hypothetical protein
LKSLFLPASVEFVGKDCFEGCTRLASLTFGSPSHLRELLNAPYRLSGVVSIPDSVEILGQCGYLKGRSRQVLSFGVESRLSEIRAKSFRYFDARRVPCRCFLNVSSRSLKVLRKKLEFETEA